MSDVERGARVLPPKLPMLWRKLHGSTAGVHGDGITTLALKAVLSVIITVVRKTPPAAKLYRILDQNVALILIAL